MKKFIRLFSIFGIDIRIHATFFILPVFFALYYGYQCGPEAGVRAAVLVLLVFACVLGHELTHSWVAKGYGVRVPEIDLYLIGGVARMQNLPRDPRKEFNISIVGPLFNFVLTALLYFPFQYFFGSENLYSPSLNSWPQMFANVLWINPFLGLFNLIPAFPMDGGRIFRALLASRLDYVRATRISANFGIFFAILFFLFGIWTKHVMLVLISFYIYFAGSDEKRHVLLEDAWRKTKGEV